MKIASETFSIDATHVLDPTLLIGREFFDKIIQKNNIHKHSPTVGYLKKITFNFSLIKSQANLELVSA
jgi:hypothetical protein